MRRQLFLLPLSLALVLVFAQAAFAWGGGGPRGLTGENWVNMADQLKLTGEQVQAIQEIQKKACHDMQDKRTRVMKLNNELCTLRWQPGADKALVESKLGELNELRQEIYKQQRQYQSQILSQLTDQQLASMVRKGCGWGGGFGGRGR